MSSLIITRLVGGELDAPLHLGDTVAIVGRDFKPKVRYPQTGVGRIVRIHRNPEVESFPYEVEIIAEGRYCYRRDELLLLEGGDDDLTAPHHSADAHDAYWGR